MGLWETMARSIGGQGYPLTSPGSSNGGTRPQSSTSVLIPLKVAALWLLLGTKAKATNDLSRLGVQAASQGELCNGNKTQAQGCSLSIAKVDG